MFILETSIFYSWGRITWIINFVVNKESLSLRKNIWSNEYSTIITSSVKDKFFTLNHNSQKIVILSHLRLFVSYRNSSSCVFLLKYVSSPAIGPWYNAGATLDCAKGNGFPRILLILSRHIAGVMSFLGWKAGTSGTGCNIFCPRMTPVGVLITGCITAGCPTYP